MENTIENKQKFFAQYYGQEVLIGYGGRILKLDSHNITASYLTIHETDEYINRIPYLELTDLSNITDEHAIEVAKISKLSNSIKGFKVYKNNNGHTVVDNQTGSNPSGYRVIDECLYQDCVDFLRSKGYAVPFCGLSVDELIKRNWVKLKTNNMKKSNIPTNRAEKGQIVYASHDLIDSLASYEECKNIQKEHGVIEDVAFYWYDNTAWNKNEPIGLISAEDAAEEDKPGCAFTYFDSTIPAFTKKAVSEFKTN